MSTTSVSFKVEALPVGWEQLDHMAKAAALLAHEERVLAAQAKAAAAAVSSLTREEVESAAAARLAAAADSARAKALGVTTNQMHQMAGGMDAAGYAAGNLRFQMFDVGQSLAGGVNPMMVLAQQGPQVAQAFTQASQAGGTMGSTIKAALGPIASMLPIVAVAAAGLAMAYQGLTAKSEAAADAQAALALGLSHTEDLLRDASRSATRLQLVMQGASSEALAAADTFYSTGDAYREATKESDALIASNVKLLELEGIPKDWESAIGGVSKGMGDLADAIDRVDGGISGLAVNTGLFAFLTSAMDGVSTSTAELERETQAAVAGQLKMRDATEDVRRAKSAEANATHKQTGASREHRKVAKEEVETLQAQSEALSKLTALWIAAAAAEMDAEHFAPPPVSEWEALANQIDQLVPQKTLTDLEKLAELSAKVTEAVGMGKLTSDQAAALMAQIDTAQVAISATSGPSMAGVAGKVGQAVSSPLSAAASMHPIAQAVLAGLQSAAGMQDGSSVFTEAADLITTALGNLGDFVGSAFAAAGDIIANAPRLLVEAIPEILRAVADGIPMLVESVATMATGLVESLAEVLPKIIPDLVIILGQVFIGAAPMIALALATAILDPAFYEAIGEAFVRGIEAAFERIGNVGEDLGQTLGTGTTAGGGFQLFGLPVVQPTASSSSVVIQPGDLWGDFTRAIGIEASKLGRT